MSRPEHDISPELLGLLSELSDQDERTLFSTAIQRLRKNYYPDADRISVRVPGLSSLERKILEAHRDEMGRLYKQVCLELLMTSEKLGRWVFPHQTEDGQVVAQPSHRQLESRFLRLDRIEADSRDLTVKLRELFQKGRPGRPSLLEVAKEGLRVAPSEALRVYEARGLEEIGEFRAAQVILEQVYFRPTIHTNKLVAAVALGRLAGYSNDPGLVVQWYERSATTREQCSAGAHSFAFMSIEAGDESALSRADQVIRDLEGSNDAVFKDFLQRVRADRFSKTWSPSAASKAMTKKTRGYGNQINELLELFR